MLNHTWSYSKHLDIIEWWMVVRCCGTRGAGHADLVQDLYLQQLRSYKPVPQVRPPSTDLRSIDRDSVAEDSSGPASLYQTLASYRPRTPTSESSSRTPPPPPPRLLPFLPTSLPSSPSSTLPSPLSPRPLLLPLRTSLPTPVRVTLAPRSTSLSWKRTCPRPTPTTRRLLRDRGKRKGYA
jgi:hypothetical protein